MEFQHSDPMLVSRHLLGGCQESGGMAAALEPAESCFLGAWLLKHGKLRWMAAALPCSADPTRDVECKGQGTRLAFLSVERSFTRDFLMPQNRDANCFMKRPVPSLGSGSQPEGALLALNSHTHCQAPSAPTQSMPPQEWQVLWKQKVVCRKPRKETSKHRFYCCCCSIFVLCCLPQYENFKPLDSGEK